MLAKRLVLDGSVDGATKDAAVGLHINAVFGSATRIANI